MCLFGLIVMVSSLHYRQKSLIARIRELESVIMHRISNLERSE